jgi:hypothetical protein
VHEAGGETYLVREPYEEFLWWLQMPELLHIAGKPSPSKAEVHSLSNRVREVLAEAEKAGYRLQSMLGEDKRKPASQEEPRAAESSLVEAPDSNPQRESEADRFAGDAKTEVDSKAREDSPIESKK